MKLKKPRPPLIDRVNDYLVAGGLFNPELANHDAVRDLLMDCKTQLEADEKELKRVYALPDLEWLEARSKMMQRLAIIAKSAYASNNELDRARDDIQNQCREMIKDLDQATLYFKRLRNGTRS